VAGELEVEAARGGTLVGEVGLVGQQEGASFVG
jgi:hypothetical protein